MARQFRSKLSYANVMATLAMFVALGGSSYAAITITGKNVPKNALTGADIKALTGKDVRNNSLTGADVKNLRSADVANGGLLAEDFAVGQLPKGEKGETGPPGPAGPSTGAAGGDLTGNYPDPSIRANAVDSASVADASLTTDDVVKEAGTFPLNLGSTAAHSCAESDVQFIESGPNTADNDPIAITPSAAWTGVGGTFTYHTRHVGGAMNGFRIVMCNISGSAVDPPAIDFHWVIFNRP